MFRCVCSFFVLETEFLRISFSLKIRNIHNRKLEMSLIFQAKRLKFLQTKVQILPIAGVFRQLVVVFYEKFWEVFCGTIHFSIWVLFRLLTYVKLKICNRSCNANCDVMLNKLVLQSECNLLVTNLIILVLIYVSLSTFIWSIYLTPSRISDYTLRVIDFVLLVTLDHLIFNWKFFTE